MIEMASFEKGMGVLAERFRSPMDAEAQKGYYAILSEELNTEDFRAAVRLAFRHSQFWPSPQQLIDFVRPQRSLDMEAAEMFQAVRDLGEAHPAGTVWRREKVAELGDAALVAFTAIGAQERLRNMDGRDMPWCRREFIEAYKITASMSAAQRAIEAARTANLPQARQRKLGTAAPATHIGEVVDKAVPA